MIPTNNNESKVKDGGNGNENFSPDSNKILSDEQLSQKHDLNSFSTTFQHQNIDESETKLSTTMPRTYAQVVCNAELVKRPETLDASTIHSPFSPTNLFLAENPKEDGKTTSK